MSKNTGLAKPTIQLTIFSFINIFLNFISQLAIAYYYGTSLERDSYLTAIVVPTFIASVFTGSVGMIFLPKIVELKNSGDKNSSNFFLGSVFILLTGVLLLLTIVGIVYSKLIIRYTAPGFSQLQIDFTSKILCIVFSTCIFSTLVNILGSIYQVEHRFIKPAIASLFVPVTSLIFVLAFTHKIGIYSLSWGYLIGSVLSFLFLVGKIRKIRFKLPFFNNSINSLIKISLPLLLSGFIFRSTTVFERMIASGLSGGSISYLGYANQIMVILATLTSSGIAVSIFPLLSKYWNENKFEGIVNLITKSLRLIFIIAFPTVLIIIIWGELIVRFFFERGAFTKEATYAVSSTLTCLMGGFVFQSLGSIFTKLFYASGKTLPISLIGTLELVLYIMLGFYITKHYSYLGLAISFSISSLINIIISIVYINKYLLTIDFKGIIWDGIKVLCIAIVVISFDYIMFSFNLLRINEIVYLIICLVIGLVLYILLGSLINIEELRNLYVHTLKKLSKNGR